LPKSCEELENDKKLDARHLVEEAMSTLVSNLFYPMNMVNVANILAQALTRNCPKCKKGGLAPFEYNIN